MINKEFYYNGEKCYISYLTENDKGYYLYVCSGEKDEITNMDKFSHCVKIFSCERQSKTSERIAFDVANLHILPNL